MFDMRLRLKELMHERGITTAYGLRKASLNNLSMTTCHRLVSGDKPIVGLEFETMRILCDLFGVTPDKLLEHKPKPLKPKEAA